MTQGFGIGLRREHFSHLLEHQAQGVDWFEIISENFFSRGGRPWAVLDKVRANHPIAMHGVSMTIGDALPSHPGYLKQLAELIERVQPFLVSDHLCWGTVQGQSLHDLLPLPWTEESLALVVDRVTQVQDKLGRQLVLENVSSYLTYAISSLSEWDFLNEVANRTGCGILLDVNNVYVCARNHGFSAEQFIDAIDPRHVKQIHLAGHSDYGTYLLDSHVGPVPEPVWQLYHRAVSRLGMVPTLVEWDTEIPDFDVVADQASRARKIASEVVSGNPELVKAVALGGSKGATVSVGSLGTTTTGATELIQRRMLALIAQPDPIDIAAKKLVATFEGIAPVSSWIDDRPNMPAEDRLNVYSQSYFHRLLEVMKELYPTVYGVLKESTFTEIIADYLLVFPPDAATIEQVGRRFSGYLIEKRAERFLADLATLDWARWSAIDCADAKSMTLAELIRAVSDGLAILRLQTTPSVKVLTLEHNIAPVWQAVNNNEEISDSEAIKSYLVVWRVGFEVMHHSLDADEAHMLRRLESAQTFETICFQCAEHDPDQSVDDVAVKLFGWLRRWAEWGLLRGGE